MPTHYQGTESQTRALNTFIKLIRAAESVASRTATSIAAFGLTPSQFGVLETLYHLGPLSVSAVASKHLKSSNNFTTVIDNLEKAGMVQRERLIADRRIVMVHLTDHGRETLLKVLPEFVQDVEQDFGVLTPEEQEQLAGLCRRLGLQEGQHSDKSRCPAVAIIAEATATRCLESADQLQD